jgi:hypothetical protein
MGVYSMLLYLGTDELVVGYGRARLRIVLVDKLREVVVANWRGLTRVIHRTWARTRSQQQVIIVASEMIRPRRPTAGHATAGEADSLTKSSGDDAPEALIESRKWRRKKHATDSAGGSDQARE